MVNGILSWCAVAESRFSGETISSGSLGEDDFLPLFPEKVVP